MEIIIILKHELLKIMCTDEDDNSRVNKNYN